MAPPDRTSTDLAPTWMDKTFFEKALRSSEEDPDLTVTLAHVESFTATGDNYLSCMYKATVEVLIGNKAEEKYFVLKIKPNTDLMNEFVTDGHIFEQEAAVMRDVAPAMQRLLEEVMPGKCQPFAARLIYSSTEQDTPVIVMENLTKRGFRMADRKSGLDFNHCLLVLRTLARFHAASVAVKQRNPELLQIFMNTEMLTSMKTVFEKTFSSSLIHIADEIEKFPKLERYSNKVRHCSQSSIAAFVEGRRRDDNGFNVLSHGDLWTNNLMFSYPEDSNCPADLRFVDYQLSHWTSPAVDLHYFILCSVSNELLDKIPTFIEEYYRTLDETLTLLGYKHLLPSLKELNDELDRRGGFAKECVLSLRCSIFADRSNVSDIDQLVNEGEVFKCSDTYLQSLEILLPLLESKGWF